MSDNSRISSLLRFFRISSRSNLDDADDSTSPLSALLNQQVLVFCLRPRDAHKNFSGSVDLQSTAGIVATFFVKTKSFLGSLVLSVLDSSRTTGAILFIFGVNNFLTYTFLSPSFTYVLPFVSFRTLRSFEFILPVSATGLFKITGVTGLSGVKSFFTYTFLEPSFTYVRPLEFLNTLRFLASILPVSIIGLFAMLVVGMNNFFTYTFLEPSFTNVLPFESLNTGRFLAFTVPVGMELFIFNNYTFKSPDVL
ncbi:hypothetical protein FR483_n163L [Paramecium bursaria Chlorella virus FR483]|uniref:Uncharacterized protein n163L n=1 Tax=Paramecium bursaria Chlorella virus FR483 TaxID=399781 RepID=A7J6L7_PBCVF|nr:hypothetical protein FR483_n163L [Paramecium bursaria Chlorella virus FR483]ABT15448.1 hypothetical protein FR483_n163L [Paramecium bursaria Chlorella virus FR483]